MVSWARSTQPLLLCPTGADETLPAAVALDRRTEVLGAELRTVIGGNLTQLPARSGEFGRHAVQQLAGVAQARVAFGAVQLAPSRTPRRRRWPCTARPCPWSRSSGRRRSSRAGPSRQARSPRCDARAAAE